MSLFNKYDNPISTAVFTLKCNHDVIVDSLSWNKPRQILTPENTEQSNNDQATERNPFIDSTKNSDIKLRSII